MLSTGYVLVIVLCVHRLIIILTGAYTVNIGRTTVCLSNLKGISGFPNDGSYQILKQTFGHNCTHIIGNLILTDLYVTADGSDPDLSFLQSIEEVTGYVIVMHSNVANIPLSNLRVIRAQNGGYRVRADLKPAALVVRRNYRNGLSLRHIDLRNLRSIVQGSVYVYDNPGLCHWPQRIDWFELFEQPTDQILYDRELMLEEASFSLDANYTNHYQRDEKPPLFLCGKRVCSPRCIPVNGKRYCWGSSEKDCQYHSQCAHNGCDRCFAQSNQSGCCHEQCIGGCFGPMATQCFGCRDYNNSGSCVPHCPRPRLTPSGAFLPGTEVKYRLGNLCVSQCPAGFLIEHDACVTHCTAPGMHAVDGICQPCDGPCPKTCELQPVFSKTGLKVQLLGASALQALSGCTHLRGDLILSNECFYPSTTVPHHEPITEVDQLWALRSLREVTGYVYMDLGYFGSKLQNLSFLENLVKVSGVFSLTRASVMIMNSMAEEPGLRSLRDVPHGPVIFHNNRKMCYLNTLPWLAATDSNGTQAPTYTVQNNIHIIVQSGADNETCARLGAHCHAACDRHGCWGPSATQCVRCQHFRAGPYQCVTTCDQITGFRKEPIDRWSLEHWPQFAQRMQEHADFREAVLTTLGQPETERVCLPCHPECRQTCNGPGADECIGGCKTAWFDGYCVAACPRDTFLNAERRVCEPCHSHCHQRETTQEPICTGPGRFPGPGGCNKCEKVLISPSSMLGSVSSESNFVDMKRHNVLCLRGDCPTGTYMTTELIQPTTAALSTTTTINSSIEMAGGMLAQISETRTHVIPVCRACHPLCKQCSAYSLVRADTKRLGCIDCTGWWFRDTCVEHCPEKDTFALPLRDVNANKPNSSNGRKMQSEPGVMRSAPSSNVVVSEEDWVRFIDRTCLACHTECHTGCWGPGPNHCNQCLHFRVHLNLMPEAMHINQSSDDVISFTQDWLGYSAAKSGEIVNSSRVRFVCVAQCPPELPFSLTHPAISDRLCHFESKLSAAAREQISIDQAIHLGLDHSYPEVASTKHHVILLWLASLMLVVTTVLLLCCCVRLRMRSWSKKHHPASPRSLRSRIGKKIAAALSRKSFNGTAQQKVFWRGESIEINTLSSNSDGCSKRETTSTAISQYSNSASAKMGAPNLGRLVMINSDDLILDEQSGPLGSGAFGAVYRGLWQVHGLEDLNPNTIGLLDDVNVENRPQSIQSCGTQSTGFTIPTDEDCATQQPLLLRFGGEQSSPSVGPLRAGRFSVPKMLHVAVKILNDGRGSSDLQALLDEAKVMASVSHRHCLPLLGVCLSQSRKCLVSAYVVNGSLDRYLRVHELDLPNLLLLDWAAQIADGMAYLQSRGIIHRDLATRNVLVTTREHLQITDFGLAKMLEGEDEVKRGEVIVRSGRVPMRWLAIETLTHGRYSFKTDVWAFGVTIWEIFTFGEKPYDRIETSNVKAHILSGGRLPQPDICTLEMYQVMLKCWHEDPEERPNFNDLNEMFNQFVQQPNTYLHSRVTSSIATAYAENSGGGDTRSRTTLYPSFRMSTDHPSVPASSGRNIPSISPGNLSNSSSPSGIYGSGNNNSPTPSNCMRRIDPRRRMRNSFLLPPNIILPSTGRFARYQQQKRRSTCMPSEHTLSTSLSMTSSGLSDRWSHSNLSHHSHPILAAVSSEAPVGPSTSRKFGLTVVSNPLSGPLVHPFAPAVLNTDSRTSSGQPLLSSDQDSSLSQLLLSNLGYNSSESRSSMISPSLAGPVAPDQTSTSTFNSSTTNPNTNTNTVNNSSNPSVNSESLMQPCVVTPPDLSDIRNSMPANFEIEAAAGYVWPQWPSAFTPIERSQQVDDENDNRQQQNSRGIHPGVNSEFLDDNLPFLNRQLWLRRSARQRQYYLRQLQIHRSAMGMALPEQASEEAIAEDENARSGSFTDNHESDSATEAAVALASRSTPPNESDTEDPADRYCPDPTSREGRLDGYG